MVEQNGEYCYNEQSKWVKLRRFLHQRNGWIAKCEEKIALHHWIHLQFHFNDISAL